MQTHSTLRTKNPHRCIITGLMMLAVSLPAFADDAANNTYTWSAELVALDQAARTVTVQSRLVSNAEIDLGKFDAGDRLTLTWSGINTAAGVRRIVEGAAPADDLLTLPIEFVSAERDSRYVRFKVPVPADDVAQLAQLSPGQWITATSQRRGARFEEAVADVRPYSDVG